MSHIIVLGGGIGGVATAYELKSELGRGQHHTITLISDSPQFQFTPSNPWVAVGWRKPGQIQLDLAKCMKRHGIEFIPQAAKKVLPDQNQIELATGETVDYDYLVIATGPELAFDEIEGLGPHEGFTHSICKTEHADRARAAFEDFVKDPGPIVVGAVQGASCFGPAYEFAFILDTELKKRKIRDRVPITYVTPEPYIGHLGLDGVGDTKSLLESEMRDRHIKWITNAKVSKITDGMMHVAEVDHTGADKQAHQLPFKYAMMLPAFRGIAAVRDVEGLVNPKGFILIDDHQRNQTYTNVYGVGVCVAIPPMGGTALPVGVPKTGYMIETMAKAAALNIADQIAGKEPSHQGSWNAVCLADFGDQGVAFIAIPQIPPRNVNWAAQGGWVHRAKEMFERYFLNKTRRGKTSTFYEDWVLKNMVLAKLKSGS